MQLLVVEDDDHVAGALVSVLNRHGFRAVRARDGRSALNALSPETDMVLLDLSLPDMDGFEVCERIRKVSDAPVIMVTARSHLDARIQGLGLGADDYLVKPYDLRELLARIDAVFRRGRSHEWDDRPASARVQVGSVCVDLAARQVLVGNGEMVALTRKEFDVVALLARHRGVTLTRERILREVWNTSWKGLGRSLEVHVGSIRRKLGEHELIETVRGVGYRLAGDH
ncbi:MAG TPA: response regulator transcription factor [Jiangellaceae bacterium]|nr:response regulator transcription factor [Jiangellaceae bacterium]